MRIQWQSWSVLSLLSVSLIYSQASLADIPPVADSDGYYPAKVTEGPEYDAVFQINSDGQVVTDWTVPGSNGDNPIISPNPVTAPIIPVPCPTTKIPGGPIFGPFSPLTEIGNPIPAPVPAPIPTAAPTVGTTPPICSPVIPTNPIGGLPPVFNPTNPISQGVVIIGQIINIGQQIWNFIQNGKAVVNIDVQSADALPLGVHGAMDLAGWRVKSKVYNVQIPNKNSSKNIDFSFNLNFEYGGSYQGKGLFLSNVTTTVGNVHTNWGTNFNVRVRVPNDGIVNVGQTADNPIAAAEVYIEWSRAKVFSTVNQAALIFVRGDGQIQNLSQGDGDPQDPPENLNPIGSG